MIFYALNATLAWRKFGQSIFEMAAIPAALGGTLEGEIEVKTRLQPQHGLHLRLSCIRQTTTGGGKNRHTEEKILWQDEKWLRPDGAYVEQGEKVAAVYGGRCSLRRTAAAAAHPGKPPTRRLNRRPRDRSGDPAPAP